MVIQFAQTMEPTDLVRFTEVILNGKLHFLCCASDISKIVKTWMRHMLDSKKG